MGRPIDVTGKRFGKLLAIRVNHLGERNVRHWLCLCDCGGESVVRIGDLTSGNQTSCGCERVRKITERNTVHGGKGTRLYRIWRGLFKRCRNKKSTDYHNYGGRGIDICQEWEDFSNFKRWAIGNGYKHDLTIERVDVDGNYCPDNCTWITKGEQAKNKRTRRSYPGRDLMGRFVANA